MSKFHRGIGGFVLAGIIASGMVLSPRQAGATDLKSFCDGLLQLIAFLDQYDEVNPLAAQAKADAEEAYARFCTGI